MELLNEDLAWVVRRMPKSVKAMLKDRPGLCVAGGFIRACVAGEEANDVDVFSPNKDASEAAALKLGQDTKSRVVTTENAYTVCSKLPVQFIHRWVFASPSDVVLSFDFTIACAAVWWDQEKKLWMSLCHDRFYHDIAAKRLVYTSPIRNEDAGGSILRVLKFYQRGYRIPLDSFGRVIARVVQGVKREDRGATEEHMAMVLTGLLRVVDPLVDPTHEAHFPSLSEQGEQAPEEPANGDH